MRRRAPPPAAPAATGIRGKVDLSAGVGEGVGVTVIGVRVGGVSSPVCILKNGSQAYIISSLYNYTIHTNGGNNYLS